MYVDSLLAPKRVFFDEDRNFDEDDDGGSVSVDTPLLPALPRSRAERLIISFVSVGK